MPAQRGRPAPAGGMNARDLRPLASALLHAREGESGAAGEFRRMMKWIAAAGVAMTIGALGYLWLFSALTLHMVVATVAGVFFSVLLGCGLFAAAFFSSKSGYDQSVADATRTGPDRNPAALPDGLTAYWQSPVFGEADIPANLLKEHNTKAGTWGLIHIHEGELRYHIDDPRRPAATMLLTSASPGVVEPTIRHHIEPVGPVRFQIEFYRSPD